MALGWHQIPNILTLLRIVLVVPFALCLVDARYELALLVFLVAGASDGLDGYLARRFDWRTRFGAIADPLADKLLLVTAYVMLTLTQVLPAWLLWIVMGRDVFIVGGALAYHYLIGVYTMQPSMLGKLNTLVQILFALLVLVHLAGWLSLAPALVWGAPVVGALAVLSGSHYAWVWGRRAWLTLRR
ncbi:MAG: CDP-alcohol phosphatidyltransferase family protein [Gammaproteobacteria bacterium]|nr:CDP-alcohol phosphatidyltransferase family protein [Gammaproteobacteria bacterium]